ncbi:Hypothetical protein D9617_15g043000 [Elsinoe fawcettii]|nr:Hypothetical protein D9617_15g043000 [Elsinoe fawcettii]
MHLLHLLFLFCSLFSLHLCKATEKTSLPYRRSVGPPYYPQAPRPVLPNPLRSNPVQQIAPPIVPEGPDWVGQGSLNLYDILLRNTGPAGYTLEFDIQDDRGVAPGFFRAFPPTRVTIPAQTGQVGNEIRVPDPQNRQPVFSITLKRVDVQRVEWTVKRDRDNGEIVLYSRKTFTLDELLRGIASSQFPMGGFS